MLCKLKDSILAIRGILAADIFSLLPSEEVGFFFKKLLLYTFSAIRKGKQNNLALSNRAPYFKGYENLPTLKCSLLTGGAG